MIERFFLQPYNSPLKPYLGMRSKLSNRLAFDFDVFVTLLTIPLIRSDTRILLIGEGDNLLCKYKCMLDIRKEVSEGSNVFAVLNNTNHDPLNLSALKLGRNDTEVILAPGYSRPRGR